MTTDKTLPAVAWKRDNEFAPFHPQASHVDADYRDGWNACHAAASARIAEFAAQLQKRDADDDRASDEFADLLTGYSEELSTAEERIAELEAQVRELREPGPWTRCGDNALASANGMIPIFASASFTCGRAGDYYECSRPSVSTTLSMRPENEAFVLAAHPQTILALVEMARRAEAAETELDGLRERSADHISELTEERDELRRALSLLAGLHPCLTTDEPMPMAQAIFDHVLSERAELEREATSCRATTEHYAAIAAAAKKEQGNG